ncbi:MAG: prepilin-type N-terminal cleavage/methylation domain-containing protein [Kiritimatiellales bacterium]|nr:prepilin-type N-terminal cleavage/methylation domain-containing protein [Kiritimatiellales bacterium]
MKNRTNHTAGFSLIEISIATVILGVALTMAFSGFLFTLKKSNMGDVQNELDIDVQLAMERLKMDLRLSSLDKIFYYPAGPGPYQAISFPLARDDNEDGLFEIDDDGKIIWDRTLIYHIWPSSPHQLKVTTFDTRDNTLTDEQRLAQLVSVVKNGNGSSTYNSANAKSTVIFENLLNWSVLPTQGQYDGYADKLERDRVSLGYCLLAPGNHVFKFKAIDKNSSSTGYKIGLDQLVVSPSYGEREAEAQLPVTSQSGAAAVSQFMVGGSWKGNYQLAFPATAPNQYFELTMDNDRWEESNFDGSGYIGEDSTVVFDESLSPKDYAVQLDGNDTTWLAAAQTGSEPQNPSFGNMQNWAVRILQKGSELADNGNWFAYNGRKSQLVLQASATGAFGCEDIYIGESVSSTNDVMDYGGTPIQVTFAGGTSVAVPSGGTATSDWIDMPIDRDKNYLVSFRIADNASLDAPMEWHDVLSASPSVCLYVTNAPPDLAASDKTWNDRTDITPIQTGCIFGLAEIKASHPESGTYTSPVFDTHLDTPTYKDLSWNADVPAATTFSMKVRTGDQPDMSDAADWSAIASTSFSPTFISSGYKRYVQFQTAMTSDSTGLRTPKLKDVTIDWTGEKRMVDIGGIFTKGPDYGVFELTVDGEPLRSALVVDLEIYRDVLGFNRATKRITSSLSSELRPRNTNK